LRRPGETCRAQAVQAAVIYGLGRAEGGIVIARVHAAGQQCRSQAVPGIDAQAQPGVARGAPVTITVGVVGTAGLGVKAIADFARNAQRIIERAILPGHAADPGLDLAGALVANAHAHIGSGGAFALAGEKLDHSANGVRTIDCGSGAAQHLDAVDLRQRNLLPLCAADGLRINAHTVDIHRRETRFGAPQKNAAGIAHATVARNLDARKARQHIGQPRGTAAFNGFAVHNGHVGHQIGQGLLGARGSHHGVLQ